MSRGFQWSGGFTTCQKKRVLIFEKNRSPIRLSIFLKSYPVPISDRSTQHKHTTVVLHQSDSLSPLPILVRMYSLTKHAFHTSKFWYSIPLHNSEFLYTRYARSMFNVTLLLYVPLWYIVTNMTIKCFSENSYNSPTRRHSRAWYKRRKARADALGRVAASCWILPPPGTVT